MKIAIAAEKADENSKVCPTAGRAPYYLIYENGNLVKKLKNPFAVGGGGAGFGVAQMLYNEEVNVVVSGDFGSNMISALSEKGIKYYSLNNISIKEALEKISKT